MCSRSRPEILSATSSKQSRMMGIAKYIRSFFCCTGARSSLEIEPCNTSSVEIIQESCPNVPISSEGNASAESEAEDHIGKPSSSSTMHMTNKSIKFDFQVRTMSQINELLDLITKVCFLWASIYFVYELR